MVDTETRSEAIERLVRALFVGTIGIVLVFLALLLALFVAILDITVDGLFGKVTLTKTISEPTINISQRVMEWFVDNVMYIAVGVGEPDISP